MSAQELLDLTESPLVAITDPAAVARKIHEEFTAAKTSEQRGSLLAIFKASFDITEAHVRQNKPEMLEEFLKARYQDYSVFIVEECTVGLDTPVVGGDVSVEMLMVVTDREVAAGRMTEDHNLRKLAINGCAAPHLSHAELIEKHQQLKAQANAPATKTLGQKLKSFFGGMKP